MKLKRFAKSTFGKIYIACVVLLALVVAGLGIYEVWAYQQPKFHDVTVELGAQRIGMDQFVTKHAQLRRCSFVSDISKLDITKVGTYELTMRHGRQEETITLTIQDTTAPQVQFISHAAKSSSYVPDPADFVESVSDLSSYTVSFKEEVTVPEDYTDITFTVVVTDAYGNATEQECGVSFTWLRDSFFLEYGSELTKADLLLEPELDDALIDQADIDAVNQGGVGQYTIQSTTAGKTAQCIITVKDTQGPELELQNVQTYHGVAVDWEELVVSATDISGDVQVRCITELDFDTLGSHTIVIEAEDIYGNITTGEATLIVTTDLIPPSIGGLSNMFVEKYSSPDFLSGVYANDEVDGACKVSVDTSSLDMTKAGVYYITYSATDNSGNTGTARRKVEVNHNEEDTAALVADIAENTIRSSDPEVLRNYVRNKVYYNNGDDWGGDDPVWYGFQNRKGNCYVHALCLKALLDYYGHENQLIWTTDKSHYWLIIKIDGVWKHIDPTPGPLHSRYSLMNDAQRLETLYYYSTPREWDFSLWPPCE